jgi:hypothetical protein
MPRRNAHRSEGDRPQFALEIIGKLIQEVKTYSGEGPAEAKQLRQLESGLRELRKLSITDALRKLVYDSRKDTVALSKDESDKLVGRLYEIRSELVHEGSVPTKGKNDGRQRVASGFEDLRTIVSDVLRFYIAKK